MKRKHLLPSNNVSSGWLVTLPAVVGVLMVIVAGVSVFWYNVPASGRTGAGSRVFATIEQHGDASLLYKWQIHRTVSPSTLNLLRGDSAVVTYGLTADRDGGTVVNYQSGSICVSNSGYEVTKDLSVMVEVQAQVGSGGYTTLSTEPVDLASDPTILNGQSACYPFRIQYLPTPNATYRVNVTASTSNFSEPPDNACVGPITCQGSSVLSEEFVPATVTNGTLNETIHVADTAGGAFAFAAPGTESFTKTYTCDADAGDVAGTATIQEADQTVQADTSSVTVNCQAPAVSPTVSVDLTRGYAWTVQKTADRTQLTLPQNQATSVNYTVSASSVPTAAVLALGGSVMVTNPSLVSRTLTNVTSQFGASAVVLNCHQPFPLVLQAGRSVTCDVQAQLSNGTGQVPLVTTITYQNVSYDALGAPSTGGVTSVVATTPIDVTQAAQHETDACVTLQDSLHGNLGSVCQGDLSNGTKSLGYQMQVGPYAACGSQAAVTNAVTLTGTLARATSSVAVAPTVSCPVAPSTCVEDFNFWGDRCGSNRHSIEAVIPLPISLGTAGGAKSLLVSTIGTARDVMSKKVYGGYGNGIADLYAGLLVAKMNVKLGATATKVSPTITAADTFLATKNWKDWNSLTKSEKSKISGWDDILEQFNDGKYGAKRCEDSDHKKRWGNDWSSDRDRDRDRDERDDRDRRDDDRRR